MPVAAARTASLICAFGCNSAGKSLQVCLEISPPPILLVSLFLKLSIATAYYTITRYDVELDFAETRTK